MNWLYKGNKVVSVDDMPEGVYGFVYEVIHKPTGKKYLGKKQVTFTRKTKIGKREAQRIKEEKKLKGERAVSPKFKKVTKESDWKDYVGSSDEVKQLLTEGSLNDFERYILDYAFHKKQLSYKETKLLFTNEVLEKEIYINSNIQGKWFRKDTKNNINE